MKPHIFAQMVNEVRDLAFDFGTCEQFRDRVADLLGKYINVEHGSKGGPEQTEAPAVVVPELTEEALVRAGGPYCINDREPFQRGARWAAAFIREHSRAIPADRELMRLVDELIRWHGLRPLDKRPDHAAALVGAIKALRTQPTQEPTP